MEIIAIYELDYMPFDRYEDGYGFIHATGRMIQYSDGRFDVEYDGDATVDLPTTDFQDENDW